MWQSILWTLGSAAFRNALMMAGAWLAAHGYLADGATGFQSVIGDIMVIAGNFFSGKNALDQGKLEKLMEDILKNIAWLHPETTTATAVAKAVVDAAPAQPKVVKNFNQ